VSTTPQERLALGVTALLLVAGVGARALHDGPPEPEWSGAPAAVADSGGLAALRREVAGEVAEAERRRRPLGAGERIDPNTAPAEEIDRLPKVGAAMAEKVVAWRQAHGAFRTLGDLDAVPGIGPAALAAIAPHVTLEPGPSSSPVPLAAARLPAAPAGPPAGGAVDLNAASAAELTALPGIGPALAERIVAWRAAHGRLRGVEELEQVPGIGPATVARLRPLVRATP